MNIRKWSTNSEPLREYWMQNKEMSAPETKITGELKSQKVLGLTWKSEEDVFSFDVSRLLEFLTTSPNTKRGLLYNPLGLLTPFTFRVKILFQILWERGLSWDGLLPEDIKGEWCQWKQELLLLKKIALPRFICRLPQVKM